MEPSQISQDDAQKGHYSTQTDGTFTPEGLFRSLVSISSLVTTTSYGSYWITEYSVHM
jgi:hypothetical protein